MQPDFMPSQRPTHVASVTGRAAVGYAVLASLAAALALALRDGVPWIYPAPWLTLEPRLAHGASAGLGLLTAALVVLLTRVTVRRFAWAQRLHLDLRPLAQRLGLPQILLLASMSSLGEELLFRGLLQPWLTLLPSAVVFGVCHQVPGPARWVWICWATAMGLVFGAIFEATGSLLGPLVAHAIINAVNLVYLRDHDPLASAR